MKVKVRHRHPRCTPYICHDPVSRLGNTLALGYVLNRCVQLDQQRRVLRFQRVSTLYMFTRHHEHMDGRDRIQIAERIGKLGLDDLRRRHGAARYPTENTVSHVARA